MTTSKIKLLFVDDELFTLRALERMMRREPGEKFFVDSAARAIEIMQQIPIDILVTDLRMPEKDGVSLLKWARETQAITLCLVLSACTDSSQILSCVNQGGIFKFLSKPVNEEELKEVLKDSIRYCLDLRKKQKQRRQFALEKRALKKAIIQKDRLIEMLEESCLVDPLTTLYNRRYLDQALKMHFRDAQRHKKDLSVLLLDLDHFKGVNDTYGHQFGDLVLREFAGRVREVVRGTDQIFRYGGEEFLVVMPETRLQDLRLVGHRIVTSCREKEFSSGAVSARVTVSGGGATLLHHCPLSREELLMIADRNLYEAKAAGRNCIAS